MDSSATSPNLRFLDSEGKPIDAPVEWTPALLEVVIDPSHWATTKLIVQDVPVPLMLRQLGGRARILAEWPQSSAGRYGIRLSSPAGNTARQVTIRPAKLSESAFTTLLDDLQTRLPAAVAIGLQRLGGLSGLTILPPAETTVAQEVARLRRAVWGTDQRPGLVQVLQDVAGDPHQMLRTEALWVPRERARRPHPADLVRAIAQRHLLAEDGLPTRVIDRRTEPTVDLYENRLVRLFADEVHRRLRRLARQIEIVGAGHARSTVADMLVGMERARQMARFLDDVTPVPYLPSQVTIVLINRPPYRAAIEGHLELHRSLAVHLEDERLDAPLENVPALYQLWGTLEVIVQLLAVAAEFGYRLVTQRLVHRDTAGAFVRIVPGGKIALWLQHSERETEVRLVPEQSFSRTSSLRSMSYTQVPDITVDVRAPGKPPCLYLFDPKYKLAGEAEGKDLAGGRPSKVDIDKMHAYRDAIRDEHGRRIVISAATMYPGPSEQYGPGLEAIQANPDYIDELRVRVSEILKRAFNTVTADHQPPR
jgi:hypothetical protein